MLQELTRREFLQATAAGGALCFGAGLVLAAGAYSKKPALVSPGCRSSKVRVAKVYMGRPKAHWPTPELDLNEEVRRYEAEFARLKNELSDVEFVVSELYHLELKMRLLNPPKEIPPTPFMKGGYPLQKGGKASPFEKGGLRGISKSSHLKLQTVLVTSQGHLQQLKEKLKEVDGILAIHLSMGIGGMPLEILSVGRPTVLFAAPYSGHEWTGFGSLQKQKEGALLECMLTSDFDQLAVAIRPFRAIHHLREAKILNVTLQDFDNFAKAMKDKFGTEIKKIGRQEVLDAYNAVPDAEAQAEAKLWIEGAEKVVEPSKDEIVRSCKLAIAFEKLLDEEDATLITVDCYGTMWRQLPAYPCIGHSRLNSMGLAGVCESDLQSTMTQILLQGLSGKPGFVNDPTMDVSKNSIILAHCMGTPKMDGPDKEPAPYKLRCVMERQEGAVPQVKMRIGQKTTTALLVGTDLLLYFTGDIIDTPDLPRGCRTKIMVKLDGDAEKLWQNWSHGLHRVTCYGDLTKDLSRFCRFKGIQLINEA